MSARRTACKTVRVLDAVLTGYAIALYEHGIQEPVQDFRRQFASYLRRRLDWSVSDGPIAAVIAETSWRGSLGNVLALGRRLP